MPHFQKACGWGEKDRNNRNINFDDYIYISLVLKNWCRDLKKEIMLSTGITLINLK